MKIKKETVERFIKGYWNRRSRLKTINPGCHGKYRVLITKSGGRIVWSMIENGEGWWAIFCYYDTTDFRVDVYDRHVFDRYRDRFLMTPDEKGRVKIVEEFLSRDNGKGIIFLNQDGNFSKRITDGACFGEVEHGGKVIYHKTFIPDSLIDKDSQQELLNPEFINYYVDNRRENVSG